MNTLTVRPAGLPAHTTTNPFLAAAHDVKSGFGKLLKFTKGEFQTGDNQLPIGTKFVAHVDQIARAWVQFSGTKLVDIKLYKVVDGSRLPAREELGDNDETLWEPDPRGGRKDPWALQWYLPLSGLTDGEVLTFVTSSQGGIGALGRLCTLYGRRFETGQRGLPVIELATDSYKHKAFGTVKVPEFKVLSWDDSVPRPQHDAPVDAEFAPADAKSSDDIDDMIPF
jgi:hypothetical protein